MFKKITCFFALFVCSFAITSAQEINKKTYTKADSLRGGIRSERTYFDVLKYDLSVEVNPEKKFISGVNKIDFQVLHPLSVMQLDLFENMEIDSIVYNDRKLDYTREANAVFIDFPEPLKKS